MYLNPPFGSEILSPQKTPPKADHGQTSRISHPFFRRVYKNIPQPPPFWGNFFESIPILPLEPTGGNGGATPSPVDISWLQPWTLKPGWVGWFGDSHPYPFLQKKMTQSLYIYIYVYKYSAYMYRYIYIYIFPNVCGKKWQKLLKTT